MFCFISLKIKNEWLRGVLVFGIGGIGVLLGTYHLFLPCYIEQIIGLWFYHAEEQLKMKAKIRSKLVNGKESEEEENFSHGLH